MTAKVMIHAGDVCMATKAAVPYLDCTCGHQHIFADPAREGRLLGPDGPLSADFATLHPKPTTPPVPFTDELPGEPA